MGGVKAAVGGHGGHHLRQLPGGGVAARGIDQAAADAEGALLHGPRGQTAHLLHLFRGGRLYGVAHNGFTQGAVTHQGGRIDAGPGLFRRGQIVRHGGIPAGGRHGAAAVAAYIGGDALQDAAFRRGAAQKGAVAVGMDIDKAGSEIQASGVHSLRGFAGQLSQGGDTAVLYRQIAVKPGRAGAVHDPGVTDK